MHFAGLQYFGEISILVDVRRTSSVRTLSRCHFYKLAKVDFDEVLEAYPELKARVAGAGPAIDDKLA